MRDALKDAFADYTAADWFIFIAAIVLLTLTAWAVLIITLIIGGAV